LIKIKLVEQFLTINRLTIVVIFRSPATLFIAGPAGRKLYVAVGTTGVRLRTARTTRLSTAVVASSASAISGTQTAVVDPGFSLADGENEVRCESQTADQLHRLSMMFICMSFFCIITTTTTTTTTRMLQLRQQMHNEC